MVKIGAIILAAGASKRMGSPKLLLPLNEKPLFQYALEVAIFNSLSPVVLIAGAHIEEFRKKAQGLNVDIIYNASYMEGMSTSLKLGIDTIKDQVNAVMIFLADQPFVQREVIHSLNEHYKEVRGRGILIVRPSYQGVLGHPIIVDATLFPKFQSLVGDTGGKEIMKKYQHLTAILPFANPIWGEDIDTYEDYVKMAEYLEHYTG